MAIDKKWLDEVSRDDAPADIATTAVRRRLDRVRALVKPAKSPAPSVESIHQLRVASRRARAALSFFKPLLRPKRTKKMNRALGRIRRAAGPARDLDVMTARFRQAVGPDRHKNAQPTNDPSHDALPLVLAQLTHTRQTEQKKLRRRLEELQNDISVPQVERLLVRVRWREDSPSPEWHDFAQIQLTPLFAEFQAAARELPTCTEQLHRIRIAGKRLRYAMELAVSVDAAIRTDLYPIMETLQEKLGNVNDLAVSVAHLRSLKDLQSSDETLQRRALKQLISGEEKRLSEEIAAVGSWWDPTLLGEMQRRWYAIFSGGAVEGVA